MKSRTEHMKFYMRIHENADGKVVAVCDSGLLGRVFEEGAKVLDLKTYAGFYRGDEAGEGDVVKELKNFSSLNLVGRDTIALAEKEGVLAKGQVREIAKIPHAQVYKV